MQSLRNAKGMLASQFAVESHDQPFDCPESGASAKHAYEACPFYLGEAHAAARLRVTFPELRLVMVLRNPWARTLSAFHDYIRHGRIAAVERSVLGMERLIIAKAHHLTHASSWQSSCV
ncbi:hypothetical protein AB1Y20_001244 [Prymnesium parvum]|uniref:Protein-tyrosine sulfotransferase n=1 Tax=Prymnesium parvum TaxID=97485 RepID=A0AB34KD03_PRYPA